ncbi:hypothetical protein vseg_000626 [Gypsophila vaccaria]
MGCSNNVLAILNTIVFILSIPILGGGIWLSRHATTVCEHYLQKPVIVLGVFLLLVALAGITGACCRLNWLLWVYLLVMFILILLLTAFTVFAFVVTNKGAGQAVSGRGYKEYRVADYSNWLRNRVEDDNNWRNIRSCLVDGKVCRSLEDQKNTPSAQFFAKNLTPIQSGCCKPPEVCNFQYVSPTTWTKPATANNTNPDCNAWSNDQTALCYSCQSCKAGVLQNLKGQWKKVAVINIVFLIFIIIVYSIGCCAFRSNRWDNSYKPYGRP